MCGVFGFVSQTDKPVNLDILKRIAAVTESRGPHSWGMAWVDKRGQLKMYKQEGRVSCSLGMLGMARDAQLLIGHCRWATHGSPEDNANNHPHRAGDGWVVHNGIIGHYQSLIRQFGLHPETDCDSEVLGLLIENLEGSIYKRACRAATLARGRSPFAMLGLWRDRLIAVRSNGQPLHIGETKNGLYLASLRDGLPGHAQMIPENQAWEFGDDR